MHNTFKNKTKFGSENYLLGGRLHVLGNGTDTHTKVPKRSSGIDISMFRTSLPSPLPPALLSASSTFLYIRYHLLSMKFFLNILTLTSESNYHYAHLIYLFFFHSYDRGALVLSTSEIKSYIKHSNTTILHFPYIARPILTHNNKTLNEALS